MIADPCRPDHASLTAIIERHRSKLGFAPFRHCGCELVWMQWLTVRYAPDIDFHCPASPGLADGTMLNGGALDYFLVSACADSARQLSEKAQSIYRVQTDNSVSPIWAEVRIYVAFLESAKTTLPHKMARMILQNWVTRTASIRREIEGPCRQKHLH